MSIIKSITDLVIDLQKKVKVNVSFGNKDHGSEDYPLIQIIPDESFTISNTYESMINYTVTLKIIVARNNELEGLEVLERLLCNLDNFAKCGGHEIGGDGESSYTTNTYEITLPFTFKIIQIPRS